jgi:hypothetical protein
MKAHLMGFIRQGLSPAQKMIRDEAHDREMALRNELVLRNTFVLLSDVKNLPKN